PGHLSTAPHVTSTTLARHSLYLRVSHPERRPQPTSPLFPYTTLFRSLDAQAGLDDRLLRAAFTPPGPAWIAAGDRASQRVAHERSGARLRQSDPQPV